MSRRLGSSERHVDIADAVDGLRQLVARVDALAHAAESLFEQLVWRAETEREDCRRFEHLAHLMGATAEAARVAAEAGSEIADALVKHRERS